MIIENGNFLGKNELDIRQSTDTINKAWSHYKFNERTLMMNTILDFSKKRRMTFLLCLFFLSLSLRLCAVFLSTLLPGHKEEVSLEHEHNGMIDPVIKQSFMGRNADFEYGVIARAIVDGKGYSMPIAEFDSNLVLKNTTNYRPSADQTPFFPYFLSLFYFFSKDPIIFFLIRIVHAIVSALTCVIVYIISLRLIHYKASFIFGILLSFYPLFISITLKIVPETFFTFWLSLTILSLFYLKDAPSLKNITITGLLTGVTILNNNAITPFLPLAGLWLLINVKGPLKNKLGKVSLVFFIAILVVSPWLVRNFLVFKKFPLLKTTAGLNLWLGNNPASRGTFSSERGEDLNTVISQKFSETFKLSEVEQDAIFYREAMDYIKAHPIHYVKSVFKRFYYYWWFPPDELIRNNTLSYKKLMAIPYGILLISCIIGIFSTMRSNWREGLLIVTLLFSVSLLYSLFVVGHLRYRVPIEPYFLLFASQTIFTVLKRIRKTLVNPYKNQALGLPQK
ncbi:MAG TPA: ArnT family glycosyltransferase [Candidatus Wunengus sp. YC61]|uniref:ArnT family glycosyltransferase n=1 Tax=Candidatus Wunengus sp. YC61 TaxID=3367698 RepID=UPI004025A1BA